MLNGIVLVYFLQAERVFAVALIQVICHEVRNEETERRCEVVCCADRVVEFRKCEILSIPRDNA